VGAVKILALHHGARLERVRETFYFPASMSLISGLSLAQKRVQGRWRFTSPGLRRHDPLGAGWRVDWRSITAGESGFTYFGGLRNYHGDVLPSASSANPGASFRIDKTNELRKWPYQPAGFCLKPRPSAAAAENRSAGRPLAQSRFRLLRSSYLQQAVGAVADADVPGRKLSSRPIFSGRRPFSSRNFISAGLRPDCRAARSFTSQRRQCPWAVCWR
jgi:hypothetical protein